MDCQCPPPTLAGESSPATTVRYKVFLLRPGRAPLILKLASNSDESPWGSVSCSCVVHKANVARDVDAESADPPPPPPPPPCPSNQEDALWAPPPPPRPSEADYVFSVTPFHGFFHTPENGKLVLFFRYTWPTSFFPPPVTYVWDDGDRIWKCEEKKTWLVTSIDGVEKWLHSFPKQAT